MQEPVLEVCQVIDPLAIGPLDASPAGGVVAGRGQPHRALVGQVHVLLHQALAEGAAAHHQPPVVVLDGSGQDLAGAGRTFIDQHRQRHVLQQTAVRGAEVPPWTVTAFRVHDHPSFGQELIGQVDGRVEVASAVAPQVQDKALHAAGQQVIGGLQEFLVRGARETDQLDVARAVGREDGGRHTGDRHLAPRDGHIERRFPPRTQQGDLHFAASRAAQVVHHLPIGDPHPGQWHAVRLQDAVPRTDAQGLRWTAFHGGHHHDGVALDGELDADALEAAFQRLLSGTQLGRTDVVAVRVQLLQEVLQHLVHQGLLFHGVHVLAVDQVQHLAHLLVRAGAAGAEDDGKGPLGVPDPMPDEQAHHQHQGHDQRVEGGDRCAGPGHVRRLRAGAPIPRPAPGGPGRRDPCSGPGRPGA